MLLADLQLVMRQTCEKQTVGPLDIDVNARDLPRRRERPGKERQRDLGNGLELPDPGQADGPRKKPGPFPRAGIIYWAFDGEGTWMSNGRPGLLRLRQELLVSGARSRSRPKRTV